MVGVARNARVVTILSIPTVGGSIVKLGKLRASRLSTSTHRNTIENKEPEKMKRVLLGLTLAVAVVGSTGCRCGNGWFGRGAKGNCASCGDCGEQGCDSCASGSGGGMGLGMGGGLRGRNGCPPGARGAADDQFGGPATAAVTYPYYTVRGPRDFLASDPRGIGP